MHLQSTQCSNIYGDAEVKKETKIPAIASCELLSSKVKAIKAYF